MVEEGYESAGVCVAIDSNQKGKCILNSGCTFHMSPLINYFTDYQKFDGGRVMMGNNTMCGVIGYGNVRLRLHDMTILEIKQVRHVPDLKRNLILLGMFDQMGYIVKVESGNLRVINGSTTVMKGTRKNGVYVLDSEVIAGESKVSVNSNINKTKL